jgi:hypothetical protein
MDLEMKVVPKELEGFRPGEVAVLHYDHKHLVNCLREDGTTETADWTDSINYIKEKLDTYDIGVECFICEESTSMSSHDCRARHAVFICDKCKAAILHIRKLLEDGGSVV